MYKLLLILKYLRRKLAPLFAALAVTLCTVMVIVVISVMGGFLDLLKTSIKTLTGDIMVRTGSYTGFAHYDRIIDELESLPEVDAATPVIEAFGLIQIYDNTIPVQIQGVRPAELSDVVAYESSLYWHEWEGGVDLKQPGMTFIPPPRWQLNGKTVDLPGVVIGIEVNPRHTRDEEGHYSMVNSAVGYPLTLTVVPLTQKGALLEPSLRKMVVVNEIKSGHYEIDANRVYVPFDLLQQMLYMDEAEIIDPDTGELTGEMRPARATELILKGNPLYSLEQVQEAVDGRLMHMVQNHLTEQYLYSMTWQQLHHTMLNAVQNEKGLVTFLFAIISVVAVVMVMTTLYMTVLEKTRDIGVLRAIGASRQGIMNLFLGYGLAIGIVGSLLGLGLAVLIVTNLNEIQDFIASWTGWRMWDPRIYAFDRIPDRVNMAEALSIVLGAILSSVIGALIPALIAARLNPIEALRHE